VLLSVEASLGPPVGSLGVIQEADEEGGSEADEGESAPAAVAKRAAAAPAARAARWGCRLRRAHCPLKRLLSTHSRAPAG
jgi:hypothetical protein